MTNVGRTWIDVQKKTFSGWANNYLKERIMRIKDIDTDLEDGILLINLLEIISGKKLPKYSHSAKTRFQKIENTGIAIKFVQNEGLKLVGIGAEDIADGSTKLTLGLLWTLILRYQIQSIDAEGFESPKAALLAWVKKRVAPYRVPVHDFDSSWQDGKALAALTDSLQVGLIPQASLSGDPVTDVNRAMDLAQVNFDIPKIMDPEDLVNIPDDLSVMTYLSYFRDYVVNADKKMDELRLREEERRRRTADVVHVYAHGPGVEPEGTYANVPARFVIQACNFYGEVLKTGGEVFSVEVTGNEGGTVEAPVTDKGDGTYDVSYSPTLPDSYVVNVTLNGLHIKDSPFHVHVDGAHPAHSTAHGPGLTQGGAHANKPAVFTVHAKDSKAQPLAHGGDAFTSRVIRVADGAVLPAHVADVGDGTYTVTYHPTTSGAHSVEVLLRDKPISGGPFSTIVYSATPENSYAEGPGLADAKALHPANFTIFAADVDGNRLLSGGEPFQAGIEGPSGEVTPAVVADNLDGTYSVTYTPPSPGDYSLVTSLHNVPLAGFPKKLYFKPSASGKESKASGTGLQDSQAEQPLSITIQARDKDGNPRTDGGDDFQVAIEKETKCRDLKVVDNGDGTYVVNYTVSEPGDYRVHVLLDKEEVPVDDSPYYVYIRPLPSAKDSYADGPGLTNPFDNAPALFTIHAVDATGKPLEEGGDTFEVLLHGPSGDLLPPTVTDNYDGTYSVAYHPDAPGAYAADIRVGGHSIHGFPRTVHVREGTAGDLSGFGAFTFTVVARDKRGAAKTLGGDAFEVTVSGPAEKIEVQAKDNGDGTYTGSYTILGTGRYSVRVVLNGKEVAGSPFVQKVGQVAKDKNNPAPVHSTTAKAN